MKLRYKLVSIDTFWQCGRFMSASLQDHLPLSTINHSLMHYFLIRSLVGTMCFTGYQSATAAVQDRALLHTAGLAEVGGAKSGVLSGLLYEIKTQRPDRAFQSPPGRASEDV